MNSPRLLYLPWQLLIFGSEALRKSFYVKKKFSEPSLLEPGFARPGTDTDNKDSQSEYTEETRKMRPPPENQEIKGPSAGKIN